MTGQNYKPEGAGPQDRRRKAQGGKREARGAGRKAQGAYRLALEGCRRAVAPSEQTTPA